MKYHWLALLIATLPGLPTPIRAGTAAPPPRMLRFCFEQHSGRGDWLSCFLNVKGTFLVRSDDTTTISTTSISTTGRLPVQETLRILEEFEKLCLAAGEHRFDPGLQVGGRLIGPYLYYESPQGKVLQLQGRENPPPPELTDFLITLTQKLLHHASKTPSPPAAPSPGNLR